MRQIDGQNSTAPLLMRSINIAGTTACQDTRPAAAASGKRAMTIAARSLTFNPQHNQVAWRVSVEDATKKYAARTAGDVYVITGPVYVPSIAQSKGIGPGQVRVPTYLFKLVYDEDQHRAWAH
jgi:hypothetical protein